MGRGGNGQPLDGESGGLAANPSPATKQQLQTVRSLALELQPLHPHLSPLSISLSLRLNMSQDGGQCGIDVSILEAL